jgi:hypothetical protein
VSANDGSTTVAMNVSRLSNVWDENSGWYNTTWMGSYIGYVSAPTNNALCMLGITSTYALWKDNPALNQGLVFMPQGNNNQFNTFVSSDNPDKRYRPFLHLTYDETVIPPSFKMPVPGNRSWVITTEVGGKDALHPKPYLSGGFPDPDYLDTAHIDENYFSIDIGGRSIPSYAGDIPIYAAAGGKVIVSTYSPYNGYYVVIDHDYDGREETGFTTRYLHFRDPPLVNSGENVYQGQKLGIMGDTGKSKGVHLHFGVRYKGDGSSSVNELSFVKIEGLPLKQFQTEVDKEGNRNMNSYFPSTNTQ